jgi:hypothetical protein
MEVAGDGTLVEECWGGIGKRNREGEEVERKWDGYGG